MPTPTLLFSPMVFLFSCGIVSVCADLLGLVRTELQRLQSFNRVKGAAKEPLTVLDKLWNTDKHRHLPLAHFLVWFEDVRSIPPWSFAPEIPLRIVEKQPPRPLKGRTEIGRVEQVGPFSSAYLRMYVHPDMFYDVAFEQGPQAYGDGVLETLESLRHTVSAILVKFDSEFT